MTEVDLDINTDERPAATASAMQPSPDVAIAAAAVAAFGAAFSGVEPTGTGWWDPVLAAAFAILFVLAAGRARRWSLLGAAAIATLFVGFSPWLAVSVAGCLALAGSMLRPQRANDLRSVAGALTFLGLLHLDNFGFFGLSALLAGAAASLVMVSAYRSLVDTSQAKIRRFLRWFLAVVAVLLLAAGVQGLQAREAANAGVEAARAGIAAARAGQAQALSQQLGEAEVQLQKANDQVTSPLLRPIALVPVAAQHVRSVQTATAQGLTVAVEARAAATEANIDELVLRQGQFDLDLFSTMAPRLESTAASLAGAVRAIEQDRSPWLLAIVDDRLGSLLDEVIVVLPETQLAAQAARVMPGILGQDGERRYLLLFGSPAEAREFGGFVGGYALIGVDDGNLELIAAGSINDLVPLARMEELDDPESYPVEYQAVDPAQFPQNLTSTPNIELLARAVQDIFPELVGAPIDGVVYLDPYALAAMTSITGPISIDGIGTDLVGDDIVDFIFVEQYRAFDGRSERFEALGEFAKAAAAGFATTDLPGPEELGRLLGPVARAGRLQIITYDDAENEFLAAVKLQRAFEAPTSVDAFAVLHANATASKLDLYLHREVRYDVTVDGADLRAVVDVQLRSEIPADVPEATFGFTDGTNQVLLSFYSKHDVTDVLVNGEPHQFAVRAEFGFFRYALFTIPLAPNASADVQLVLEGEAPDEPYRLGVWAQPGVHNDKVEIIYRTPGEEPVSQSRELREGWLFDPSQVGYEGEQ